MLDFVEPSAPRSTVGADLPAAARIPAGESDIHYWPCEVLDAFILQMAARGHCVNTAMMLGHPPYASEQLALARAHHDAQLDELVTRLCGYFTGASAPAACAPGSTQTLLRPWPLAA